LKHLGTLLTLAIFAFWAAMNSLVVIREKERKDLDKYRQGVSSFLGGDLYRERWLGIYKKNKRIGYTGYVFEKVFAAEGVEVHSSVECRMEIDIFGRPQAVSLTGNLILDEGMRPVQLRMDAHLDRALSMAVTGKRRDGGFAIEARAGPLKLLDLSLPLEELHLGNGLVPSFPISGFKVGDEFQVPCFDPIVMSRSPATVRVVSKEERSIEGFRAEVFVLETEFHGKKSRTWVTDAGELLRQEFAPPLDDIVLRRERKEILKRDAKK
jgi:hypothetical protein